MSKDEGELQRLIRQNSGRVSINPKVLFELSSEERHTFIHLYVLEMDVLKFIEDAKKEFLDISSCTDLSGGKDRVSYYEAWFLRWFGG